MDILAKGPQLQWINDGKQHERFNEWNDCVTTYCTAMELEKKDKDLISLCLNHWSGKRGKELILKSEKATWRERLGVIEKECQPRGSTLVAAAEYKILAQGEDEIPEFISRCQAIVNGMGIKDTNAQDILTRNAIMLGLKNPITFKRCLEEENQDSLSSERVISIALNTYRADAQQTIMQTVSSVTSATAAVQGQDVHKMRINFKKQKQSGGKVCYRCGGSTIHRSKDECPAGKAKCDGCGVIGHFRRMCRKEKQAEAKVKEIQTQETSTAVQQPATQHAVYLQSMPQAEYSQSVASDVEFKHIDAVDAKIHNLTSQKIKKGQQSKLNHIKALWFSTCQNEVMHEIQCEVDSGAGCNVMPLYIYKHIFKNREMDPPGMNIFGYGGNPIKTLGSCLIKVHTAKKKRLIQCQITDTKGYLILGRDTAEDIGYVQFPKIPAPNLQEPPIVHTEVKSLQKDAKPISSGNKRSADHIEIPAYSIDQNSVLINGNKHTLPLTEEYIHKAFADVFEGIGTLPGGAYHITLKKDAVPVQHAPRTVPEKKKEAYIAELKRLCELQIIVPVNTHTEWINSIVPAVKSNGDIRLCLDPKDLNANMERNPYYSRTVEEVQAELGTASARMFTLLDAKSGFWMVHLDEESSYLTTFNTPWGKFRWLRLPFGLKVSSDVFQERLDAIISKIKSISNIADDCLVYGKDSQSHDVALLQLLESARLNGIKFNKDKMQFKTEECNFFGEKLTPQGMEVDPKKVQAISEMKPPMNKTELQSFLGMVNYLKRYSCKLTEITGPLRNLVKADSIWSWESSQQEAFEAVKAEVTKTPVLAYFDRDKEHSIQADASMKGLGAVLLQNGRPVIYISRSLTPTEQNYSNIERELLGVVFAVERLHRFIFGGQVTVQTDHKPLEMIFKKNVVDVPPRLQRFMLRLHRYDIKLEYLKGKDNVIADALSRVSPQDISKAMSTSEVEELDMIPVNQITSTIPAQAACLDRVRNECTNDEALNQLKHYIIHGWPLHRNQCAEGTQPYWTYREELSIENGLIFKSHRLVVPESERPKFLATLHTAHMGEEKMLLLARQHVFWPGITEDVKNTVRNCNICQATRPSQQKETLLSHEVPSAPWEKIAIDIFELNNTHYLLCADYFSKFPIVRYIKSLHSKEVIDKLKTIFSEHGNPKIVYTDQGTQFTSAEFQKFASQYNFEIQHSSPRYPQANGFAEAMVKVVKGILARAKEAGEDLHLALQAYRATPVNRHLPSPAEMLYSRKLRSLLPSKQCLTSEQQEIRETQFQQKDKQNALYNQHARVYEELDKHQQVRVQIDPNRKLWQQATVVETPHCASEPRSYVVRTPDGAEYQRNRRFVKPSVPAQNNQQMITRSMAQDPTPQDVPKSKVSEQTNVRPRRESKPPARLMYEK